MKFLFVSDFENNPNLGAGGSLITIGKSLEVLGHEVDFIWRQKKRHISIYNIFRFIELPYIQYKQLKKELCINNYDVVQISQPFAWLAAKKLKKKYPSTLFINRTHGWELRIEQLMWTIESDKNKIIRHAKNFVTKKLLSISSTLTLKYCDALICASSSDADFVKEFYPHYRTKVHLISYGLGKEFLNQEKVIPLNTNKTKMLFAGQYVTRKGVIDLQHIFKKIAHRAEEFDLTFIINQDSVQQACKDFDFIKTSSLHVQPWVDRNELLKIYKQNDVFLMPSYGEGFGKTSIEAMACGLCVVGYSEGALADLGKNKQNALLTNTGNVKGLIEIIEFALDYPQKVKEMGFQAYNDVQSQTWEKNASETIDLMNYINNNKIIK